MSPNPVIAQHDKGAGVAFVTLSSIGFGLIPFFATKAYRHGADPFGLLTVRFPWLLRCCCC